MTGFLKQIHKRNFVVYEKKTNSFLNREKAFYGDIEKLDIIIKEMKQIKLIYLLP